MPDSRRKPPGGECKNDGSGSNREPSPERQDWKKIMPNHGRAVILEKCCIRSNRGGNSIVALSINSLTARFSDRLKRRFSVPACPIIGRRAEWPSREARSRAEPRAAAPLRRAWRARRALDLDGREHGATLDQVGSYSPARSWFFPRSVGSRNMASGRAAPLCPERGHPEGAATKDARLPGLVPAGTCSRPDQAELCRPTGGPDTVMRQPPGRRPS